MGISQSFNKKDSEQWDKERRERSMMKMEEIKMDNNRSDTSFKKYLISWDQIGLEVKRFGTTWYIAQNGACPRILDSRRVQRWKVTFNIEEHAHLCIWLAETIIIT